MPITPEQIPRPVLEEVVNKVHEITGIDIDDEEANVIAVAALNAWPWTKEESRPNISFDGKPVTVSYLVLPLPKEGDT